MNILKIKHSLVTKLDKGFLNLYEEYYIKEKNPKNRYFVLKKSKEDGLTFLSNVISLLSIIKEDVYIVYGIKGINIFMSNNKSKYLWVNTQIMEIYYGKKYDDINGDEKKYFLDVVLKKINKTLGFEFKKINFLSTPESVTEAIFKI